VLCNILMNNKSHTQKSIRRMSISSSEDLKIKLLEGTASLDRGEGIDGDQAFDRLRQRIKERKVSGKVSQRSTRL
jgi:hypothetical protein